MRLKNDSFPSQLAINMDKKCKLVPENVVKEFWAEALYTYKRIMCCGICGYIDVEDEFRLRMNSRAIWSISDTGIVEQKLSASRVS
jgi:hypothetical protein